jgi:hypothetical protein
MVKGSSLCAFRAALCNFIGTQARVSGRLPGLRTRPSPAIRFCRGNDVAEWLHLMEHHNISVDSYPLRGGVRDNANYHFTDRNGGRDIDFRRFAVSPFRRFAVSPWKECGCMAAWQTFVRVLSRSGPTWPPIWTMPIAPTKAYWFLYRARRHQGTGRGCLSSGRAPACR